MNYLMLPETMETETLRKYFCEFLEYHRIKENDIDTKIAVDELYELADRQWNSYELIDEEVKSRLERYLVSIVDLSDYDLTDTILSIIPRLGMGDLFSYILNNKSAITDSEILRLVEDAEKEYGQTVNDPYFGMRATSL